jgi:hypothetical protein
MGRRFAATAENKRLFIELAASISYTLPRFKEAETVEGDTEHGGMHLLRSGVSDVRAQLAYPR